MIFGMFMVFYNNKNYMGLALGNKSYDVIEG